MDFATNILTDKTRPSLWLVKMNWTQDDETMYLELIIGARDKQSVKDIAINYAKSNIRKTNPSDIHLTYTSFGRLQDSRTYYKSPLMHKINVSGRKSELKAIDTKDEIPSYELLMLSGLLAKYYPNKIYDKTWYQIEVKTAYDAWLRSKKENPNKNFQDYIKATEQVYAEHSSQSMNTNNTNSPEITTESCSNLIELQTITQALKQDLNEILSNETLIKNLIERMTQQTETSVNTMTKANDLYEFIINKFDSCNDDTTEEIYEENITLKPDNTVDSQADEPTNAEYDFWHEIATQETKDFLTNAIINECHINNIMYIDNHPDFQKQTHTFIELLEIIMTTGIDFKKKETIEQIESLMTKCAQAYKQYHKDATDDYTNNDIIEWLKKLSVPNLL